MENQIDTYLLATRIGFQLLRFISVTDCWLCATSRWRSRIRLCFEKNLYIYFNLIKCLTIFLFFAYNVALTTTMLRHCMHGVMSCSRTVSERVVRFSNGRAAPESAHLHPSVSSDSCKVRYRIKSQRDNIHVQHCKNEKNIKMRSLKTINKTIFSSKNTFTGLGQGVALQYFKYSINKQKWRKVWHI